MPFKLTIIGSGSAVPTLKRGVTSQYINFNERHILIDCGEGTQLQMRRYKIKFQRIQMILISHLHGDHYLGLTGLLSSMSLLGRKQDLTIYCPAELEELLRFQFKIAGVKFKFHINFIHLTVQTKELIFEDRVLEVSAFPVQHRIPCWGFHFKEKARDLNVDKDKIKIHNLSIEEILKVKKGEDIKRESQYLYNADLVLPSPSLKSYAYSADTRYFEEMLNYVKDVDLLYHEATFTEKHIERAKKTMHSTAREAALIAKGANVKHLILGHFSARFKNTDEVLAEANSVFDNVCCVEDGDEFVL